MTRKIENPRFINNARTTLEADFVYDDGRILIAQISSPDGTNVDWVEIMQKFSLEEIEANTKRNIQKKNAESARGIVEQQANIARKTQEELFQLKLQAFEITHVKNSTDVGLKSAIRKSKNQFEVLAHTAALILKESAPK